MPDTNPNVPRGWHFPVIRRLLGRWEPGRRWLERHQLPFNLFLHLLGIPLAFLGLVALCAGEWRVGLGGLTVGYLLQFVGHHSEGNDLGEWAALKRLLGRPCVLVSPRWREPA
jgi:hypothetical protein